MSRLTDRPKTYGKKENLTLKRLADLVDVAIRADVESLIRSAEQKCASAHDWRNRRIAHRDLALALEEDVEPLTPASRKSVREGLDAIAAVLNRLELHYCGGEVGYQYFESRLSARALVHVLEEASALAKNDQFVLSKSDPHEEQDLAQCKPTRSSIIHAEGV
jgi:hypothetical protein